MSGSIFVQKLWIGSERWNWQKMKKFLLHIIISLIVWKHNLINENSNLFNGEFGETLQERINPQLYFSSIRRRHTFEQRKIHEIIKPFLIDIIDKIMKNYVLHNYSDLLNERTSVTNHWQWQMWNLYTINMSVRYLWILFICQKYAACEYFSSYVYFVTAWRLVYWFLYLSFGIYGKIVFNSFASYPKYAVIAEYLTNLVYDLDFLDCAIVFSMLNLVLSGYGHCHYSIFLVLKFEQNYSRLLNRRIPENEKIIH